MLSIHWIDCVYWINGIYFAAVPGVLNEETGELWLHPEFDGFNFLG